ncbi:MULTISPECIES: DUF6049 family protein [Nocardioides]|uniref:DUF6049 family protein n=1 Tax=Nocardioides vastitatis TaxID=2568655 RepID=A0ABW0ZJT6_9ACTN|nr:DUF6049 family protein [Nocardioides sp.]THI96736.1 hypothetical protein E7Z54_15815 [Nocardioides sp.]
MVHRPSFLPALAGVVTSVVLTGVVLGGPAAGSPDAEPVGQRASAVAAQGSADAGAPRSRQAPDEEYDAPLHITIDELTPGALPRRGPLVVRGTVTNADLDGWQGISLYPMINGAHCTGCAAVMTTSAELKVAAESDPESPVGERICTSITAACSGVVQTIQSLAPGATARYTMKIPQAVLRAELPKPTAGVYWFGVHASGESASTPRDHLADGRARTFLPYVPERSAEVVDTAVVLPLRGRIAYTADGQLGRTARWQRALSSSGDLGGPLAFGAASGDQPVTWLVDPALPDAVRHLARGNTPREIEAVPQEPDEPSPTEDDTGTGDDDSAGAAADDGAEPADGGPLARAADSWLRRAEVVLGSDRVATLPYGDPDVAAAATSLPDLYDTAREHPGSVLTAWNVKGTPVVAPPTGYLDQTGIESVSDGAVVVLGDQMFPEEAYPTGPPATGMVDDHPVVVSTTGAAEGGPGPDSRLSPVALRQRILSEAAVRLSRSGGDAAPQPLVVLLPTSVAPAGASEFWQGLDVSWLRLTDLDAVADQADGVLGGEGAEARQIDPATLDYPEDQELLEVDSSVLVELGRLVRASRSLQSILGDQYRIAGQLLDEALTGASYSLRADPRAGLRLARTRGWVEDQLAQLSVDAPRGVTLSGTSGSFNVAVRNTLDYPVSVRIEATTDQGAEIGVANPIVLAANSRSSVPIEATMTSAGVHNVTLRLTDLEGNPIGADDELPIRSGQVGVVIWAIIGTGVGILFVAIGIRLFRRIRAHRHGGEESGDAGDGTAGDGARSAETEDAGAP